MEEQTMEDKTGEGLTLKTLSDQLERIERLTLIGAKTVLDLDEAVELTGYSRGHLYRLTSSRDIPHYKQGRKIFFKKSELEAWMLEDRVPTNKQVLTQAMTHVVTHPMKKKNGENLILQTHKTKNSNNYGKRRNHNQGRERAGCESHRQRGDTQGA